MASIFFIQPVEPMVKVPPFTMKACLKNVSASWVMSIFVLIFHHKWVLIEIIPTFEVLWFSLEVWFVLKYAE